MVQAERALLQLSITGQSRGYNEPVGHCDDTRLVLALLARLKAVFARVNRARPPSAPLRLEKAIVSLLIQYSKPRPQNRSLNANPDVTP